MNPELMLWHLFLQLENSDEITDAKLLKLMSDVSLQIKLNHDAYIIFNHIFLNWQKFLGNEVDSDLLNDYNYNINYLGLAYIREMIDRTKKGISK